MQLSVQTVKTLALVTALSTVLSACETSRGLIKNLLPLEGSPHTFRNVNYTATDEMAQQLQRSLPGQIPMTARPLKAVPLAGSQLPEGSPLPNLIMQQVSGRLVQHGYKVTTAYPASAPEPVNPRNKDFAQVTLGGDYLMTGGDLVVHLEVQEEKSGRLLAAHDYTVPITEEVRGYMVAGAAIPAEPTMASVATGSYGGNAQQVNIAPLSGMQAVPVSEVSAPTLLDKPATVSGTTDGTPLPMRKPAR